MKPPPGCPLRQVDAVFDPRAEQARGFGKMLKLACGHVQWRAGITDDEIRNIVEFNSFVPCLEAPCYQRQISMGDQA